MIDQGYSVGEIVEHIVQRYDGSLVRIIDDINALVATLQAEELIVPMSDAGAPPRVNSLATTPAAKTPYSAPLFERFDDMQELLLLDPIHEVGEEGWPHAKTDEF